MNRKKRKLMLGSSLLLVSLLATGIISACTTGSDNPLSTSGLSLGQSATGTPPPGKTRNFTLYVRDALIKMPDGTQIYMYGFTDDPKGRAKIPGPKLEMDEGDSVTITLVDDKDPTKTRYNEEGDGHTIHLHGLDLESKYDGDPMTQPGGPVKQGQSYVYRFVARYAGTYWYHCHVEAPEHIQMGMYGPLIIHPRGESTKAYHNTPPYDKEYTFVLSDIDSKAHQGVYNALNKNGEEVKWTDYHPNYFLINGKAWPDTMMDPNTSINATVGQKVLVRLINTGDVVHMIHTHGYHFLVLGTDGRKLDMPYYKDTLAVGPAERYEILLDLNLVGRYMFHDHVEGAITNDGGFPGGMITMINVNNPDGSNPVPMPKME
ncbi:MAG: multicopper oxidase domain-containing protein [Ktedonobacteraceae bacterium]|nr:multicopper oxidase domain-containing protein [Ktedonobacteraceae bacterium]